jgi:hypothetical protein
MPRLIPLVVLCLLLTRAETAAAAAPNVIIVQGDLLSGPIVLDDWDENLDLMLGLGEPQTEPAFDLRGRRKLEVSLFWAVGDYLEAGVEPLQLLDTDFPLTENHEIGTLYLGTESSSAILDYHGYRVVEPGAAEILSAHGVPLVAAPVSGGMITARYVGFAAIALGAFIVALYAMRRRGRVNRDVTD